MAVCRSCYFSPARVAASPRPARARVGAVVGEGEGGSPAKVPKKELFNDSDNREGLVKEKEGKENMVKEREGKENLVTKI